MSFFGTDGIRGRVGEGKLSDDNLARMGAAIGAFIGAGGSAVIGRDTRESGPHIQAVIEAGLVGAGVEVKRVGVLPTPATALATEWENADLGIMVTASHNPWHDNGVKLFSPDGRKLSDTDQSRLESLIVSPAELSGKPGEVTEESAISARYRKHILSAIGAVDLSSLTIVVDGAHGAGHAVLPKVLREAGAKVIAIGADPNGRNINAGVGSTHPEALQAAVRDHAADVGFALDGDADRIIAIDNTGAPVDGDQIVARLAADAKANGTMTGGAVVSTVMANLGLERWAEDAGLALHRTKVGDRYVAQRMAEIGANIGGEPSGHILLTDLATTGDGCLTALCLAASLARHGGPSAEVLQMFEPVPQTLKSVRFSGEAPLLRPDVTAEVARQTERLHGIGRLLVRPSGTEPVIRVMAEGDDADLVSDVVEKLCAVIAKPA